MTRQKKELESKIKYIEEMINVDMELGCGFAPAGYYDEAYQEQYRLEEQLAALRHYKSVEEMWNDTRWMNGKKLDLPFTA